MGQNLFFYALKTVDTPKTVLAMFLNTNILIVWLDFMKKNIVDVSFKLAVWRP